jgi:hypothetical protein
MEQYRAKRWFGYYKLVDVGEIILLNDDESNRLAHLVEKIDSSNFADDKPNKLYKKGRRKKL